MNAGSLTPRPPRSAGDRQQVLDLLAADYGAAAPRLTPIYETPESVAPPMDMQIMPMEEPPPRIVVVPKPLPEPKPPKPEPPTPAQPKPEPRAAIVG